MEAGCGEGDDILLVAVERHRPHGCHKLGVNSAFRNIARVKIEVVLYPLLMYDHLSCRQEFVLTYLS